MTARRPRIGILGIMQDLYDDMIPGIAQRQAGYAAEIAEQSVRRRRVHPGRADQVPRGRRAGDGRVRARRPGRRAGGDAHLRPGDAGGAAARRVAAADLPGQHPARAERHPGLGHGRHDLQPGRARGAGHRQRDGPGRAPVPRADRRLARGVVPRRRGPVGAGGRGGHPVEVAQGGDLRLRHERHGRHPGGRERADPDAGPGDPGRRARRHVPGHAGGHRRPGGRRDRVRGRAVRDRPAAVGGRAGGPRPDAGGDQGDPGRPRLRGLYGALRRDRRGRPVLPAAAGRGVHADGRRATATRPRATC